MVSWQSATLMMVALRIICGTEEGSTTALRFVVNLVNDVCQNRDDCADGVLDDLIFLISGDPYDPSDRDSGTSRMTVLLEVIDDKCELDAECSEKLFAEMRDRIINERSEFNDEVSDSSFHKDENEPQTGKGREGYKTFSRDQNMFDFGNIDGFLSLIPTEMEYLDNLENFDETPFERFELKDHVDETVLNTMMKDECQQNRAACAEYVEKQRKLGLNHIGKIRFDEDGEPVAEVPDSVFFEAELNVPDGGDDPE